MITLMKWDPDPDLQLFTFNFSLSGFLGELRLSGFCSVRFCSVRFCSLRFCSVRLCSLIARAGASSQYQPLPPAPQQGVRLLHEKVRGHQQIGSL
ncbi:unnamed protein product [Boreogadus saida]